MVKLDPVTLEVIRNYLLTVAQEMKSLVMRSAYSALWKEGGDLSCGILTPKAEIVAQGPDDIPAHLATMPFSVKGAVDRVGIENIHEGDILLHNDPYSGNNHLPDFLAALPVFYGDEIVAYTAVRAHWVDVGGITAGSYSSAATEIYQEGLRIPPSKIVKRGRINKELLDVILSNVRAPAERSGDLMAQLSGCQLGERRIIALIEKYSLRKFLSAMETILEYSERMTRREISKMREGSYSFTDYCDEDELNPEPIKIHVTATVKNSEIIIDFTGSSPQVKSNMNAPLPVTYCATYYGVKMMTDPWNPSNSGCYRPIKVVAPEMSVVNPRFPAAVAAGNHETASRITEVVVGALSQACPEKAVAAGSGTSCVLLASGVDNRDERKGRRWIHYEVNSGGVGARSTKDGVNAFRWGVGNTANTPVEILETLFPLMVERYELITDSGGAGKYRGGLTTRKVYRFLNHSSVVIVSDRGSHPPFGLFGGKSGRPAKFTLVKSDGRELVLKTRTREFYVEPDDIIVMEAPGSGGLGNPLERDRELVVRDVLYGYVSPSVAEAEYGVRVDSDMLRRVE
ncbi:MAG: hydantoinase B/oxoprolinase family protein [Candidatus Caldarchaeum sp.]